MRKPRVIIYDDDVSLLELLEACFTRWGYEVFSYRAPVVCPVNGNSAQECNLQAPCADLMISDFLMPQTTGTEFGFGARLKEDARWRRRPLCQAILKRNS